VRGVAYAFLVAMIGAGTWLAWALHARPDAASVRLPELAAAAPQPGALRVTFLGVSTVLLDDGETAILTDGFFSRPSLLRTLLLPLEPDRERVARALARAGVRRLAAVIVAHSHYDHAMDSPLVAQMSGALLVGSESTANVGRGAGLDEARIRVFGDGATLRFGAFTVRAIPGRHLPHGQAMGEITAPLAPPARALDYLEGGSYSLLFEHGGRTLLLQSSAGFEPGALAGQRADTVLLGVGGLGRMDAQYRDDYWREVVAATGARRVVPVHWDDFTQPLEAGLRPLPRLLDDYGLSLDFLRAKAVQDGVRLDAMPLWSAVDPFAGL
jgi:L-ascorbate metabolism protein UlaG (beta-lactamase superfamily)